MAGASKSFSIVGEVAVDTTKVNASLKQIAGTQTKARVGIDDRDAKRQAQGMLTLMNRMDRARVRPKVDVGSVVKAQGEVTKLDRLLAKASGSWKGGTGATGVGAMRSRVGGGMGGMFAGAGMGSMMMGGLGLGAGVMGAAGIGTAIRGAFTEAMGKQKLESFMPRAYGSSGDEFIKSAEQLADVTGYMSQDFMRAALLGKSLVANYGLQTEQISKLIAVSADLAATSPYEDIQTVSNAMERLQSAVRGEAEASERLGLTLNDTYMKNIAFNGALRATWEKLSDAEKAQYRYNEILNQTNDVLGAAEDEGLAKSLRDAKQRFTEAGAALAGKLLPAVTKLIELAASIPTGVYEGLGYAGMAVGAGLAGRGLFRMGKSLVGRFGGSAAEVASTAAAQVAASKVAERAATAAATKAATTAATKAAASAATTAATTAGAQFAGGLGGNLVAQSAVSAIASVGGLAAIAAAAGLVIWGVKTLEKETNAAYEQAAEAEDRTTLLSRETQQKQYGIDWGVYRDESGVLQQGQSVGWDKKADAVFESRNMLVNGKPRTMLIPGTLHDVNEFGQAIGTPYQGQFAQGITTKIVLENNSGVPLKATDAESYAPSNY